MATRASLLRVSHYSLFISGHRMRWTVNYDIHIISSTKEQVQEGITKPCISFDDFPKLCRKLLKPSLTLSSADLTHSNDPAQLSQWESPNALLPPPPDRRGMLKEWERIFYDCCSLKEDRAWRWWESRWCKVEAVTHEEDSKLGRTMNDENICYTWPVQLSPTITLGGLKSDVCCVLVACHFPAN